MSTYEAWRITYQDAEAAAKAAFEQVQGLAKMVDGLQAALGRQVRFGGECVLAAIEKLPRYAYGYQSDEWGMNRSLGSYVSADGKFLLRDDVLAAIASQVQQATPTADMGNTTSQPPSATDAGNPASGAQDKMSTTQQPAALRLADEVRTHDDHPRVHFYNRVADELRSQHARIAEMEAVLSAMGEKGNPVQPADIPRATDQDTHFFLAGWNGRAAQADALDADRWMGVGKAIFGDEDHVLVPRGLIGAACYAIEKKRDGIKTLAELRRYTKGDLSASAPQPPVTAAVQLPVELLERIQESLGSFVGDQGWSQFDMDTADALDGLLAAHGITQEKQK